MPANKSLSPGTPPALRPANLVQPRWAISRQSTRPWRLAAVDPVLPLLCILSHHPATRTGSTGSACAFVCSSSRTLPKRSTRLKRPQATPALAPVRDSGTRGSAAPSRDWSSPGPSTPSPWSPTPSGPLASWTPDTPCALSGRIVEPAFSQPANSQHQSWPQGTTLYSPYSGRRGCRAVESCGYNHRITRDTRKNVPAQIRYPV